MADDDLDAGAKDRFFYTARSLQNAFGDSDPASFDPTVGFAPNRGRMVQIYNYYQSLYQKKPDLFLWAGLGHLAGATVVSGLDMVLSQDAEGDVTHTLVDTAKQIFLDIAWLHEAFLDDPQTAISLAGARDSAAPTPAASYAKALTDIASLDPTRVADGNQALLRNEQFCLVQACMDKLRAANAPLFSKTSAFTYSVHPYHRDFIIVVPSGDVSLFNDRWSWITEPDGMWAKWVAMPGVAPDERNRLVALDFDTLIARNFGPLVDALLPTGANAEQ